MQLEAHEDSVETRDDGGKELSMSEYLERRFPVDGTARGERERGYEEYRRRIKK
ncbi:MAG: hypothetical protein KJO07_11740 [Deltaproteobacteria bacterium]|nr:hypothetical protein [Deltaproteobacteria bacterium]